MPSPPPRRLAYRRDAGNIIVKRLDSSVKPPWRGGAESADCRRCSSISACHPAMMSAGAIARRARAALSGIMWSRKGELCPYSTSYAVRRRDPVLVCPAAPTPRETKPLSDLDDNDLMRMHMSVAFFYRGRKDGIHPAGVIRRALAKALVPYYPLAGRLREMEGRKLVVDCTGEGVLFVQAEADVQLADLDAAGLPFPGWDQLLFQVEGSSGLLNTPLMLIQVTRLLCGGFVLALRFSHTMCDGMGIAQFMNAVSELARGLPCMTVTPVWSRELIMARSPAMPRRPELDVLRPPAPAGDMATRSFTFSHSDVAKIKNSVTATTFEALTAFLWRARTAALQLPPGEHAPLAFPVNIRGAGVMNLPAGYYGNAAPPSTALVGSAALCQGSLGDAVTLVRRAKAAVTTEYVRSTVDEMVLQDRRVFVPANMLAVSDARRIGLERVDFGWGKPVFAGPAEPLVVGLSYFIAVKDRGGEDVVSVPVVLPKGAMDRFATEVERSLEEA
ncbi:unnamed protein product [Alopecurus aequalis]